MRNEKGQFVKGNIVIVSEETKIKIGLGNKGKIRTDECKRNLSEWRTGKYKGKDNPNWHGGIRENSNGYRRIYKPEHPNNSESYVYEHRLVMEDSLGRYLLPWEIVHHINGIKKDNRIENLKLLPEEEHNKEVQKVYQENLQLKQKILELQLLIA